MRGFVAWLLNLKAPFRQPANVEVAFAELTADDGSVHRGAPQSEGLSQRNADQGYTEFTDKYNSLMPVDTFADRVIEFNRTVEFNGTLPYGINIMNPFRNNDYILQVSSAFYTKFYYDNNPRRLILGINPGRFGAGFTGVPFTDTKRLISECGIPYSGRQTHEPSSVFIYDMISAYGGPERFYSHFYITSVCPLGFTQSEHGGRVKNFNYYDRPDLTAAVYDFMVENIRKQIALGVMTDTCFCLGTGKNEKFLVSLNAKYHFFDKIIALEHPRFIMQYRSKSIQDYIGKYLQAFRQA